MPIVIENGLNAVDFCNKLKLEIRKMSPKAAFGVGRIVVAYSGPSTEVKSTIKTTFTSNWTRSRDQAARMGGRRIDDTYVGKFLAKFDFDDYFRAVYPTDIAAREQAEFSAWATASKLFMQAQFKELATAVCAADPERVFRQFEMDSALNNAKVKVVNNRPVDLFKDFYKIHADEAYRLFCLTELLESRARAVKENSTEAWNDYRERRAFFIIERSLAKPYATTLSADQIKQKRNVAIAKSHLAKASAVGAKRPSTRATAPRLRRAP